jgi:hypothetical protein
VADARQKSFDDPDETRMFERGRVDIVTVGDVTVGRGTLEPGWRWSEQVRPIVGTESCQVHHVGFCIAGHMRTRLDDGTIVDTRPGDVYDIPPGHDSWVVGDEAVVSFEYSGAAGSFATPAAVDRVLVTLLFTDMVGSTQLAERLRDAGWQGLLARHNRIVRAELDRFRGREAATTGDGFLATFDGAARAVRCAASIRRALEPLGIAVRAGIHTGEIEYGGGDMRGVTVHAAARVMSLAGAGEIPG